jgi:hypothetical protein
MLGIHRIARAFWHGLNSATLSWPAIFQTGRYLVVLSSVALYRTKNNWISLKLPMSLHGIATKISYPTIAHHALAALTDKVGEISLLISQVINQFKNMQCTNSVLPGFFLTSGDLIVVTKASDEFRCTFYSMPETVTQSRRISCFDLEAERWKNEFWFWFQKYANMIDHRNVVNHGFIMGG